MAVLALAAFVGVASGQSGIDAVEKLRSRDAKERAAARDALLRNRQETIAALIPLVKAKPAYELLDSTPLAIEILGDLRAAEAVDQLAANITLTPPVIEWEIRRKEERYLCAVALAKIGVPAVPAMLKIIRTGDDEVARQVAAWVLNEVLGADLAPVLLEGALKSAERPEEQARIKAALQYVQRLRETKR
jgi:hypothetical protein